VLRQSALISAERRGRTLMYAVNRTALRPVWAWAEAQRST